MRSKCRYKPVLADNQSSQCASRFPSKYFDSRHGRMLRTILAAMAIVLTLHAPSAGVCPLLHTLLLSARLAILQTHLLLNLQTVHMV